MRVEVQISGEDDLFYEKKAISAPKFDTQHSFTKIRSNMGQPVYEKGGSARTRSGVLRDLRGVRPGAFPPNRPCSAILPPVLAGEVSPVVPLTPIFGWVHRGPSRAPPLREFTWGQLGWDQVTPFTRGAPGRRCGAPAPRCPSTPRG